MPGRQSRITLKKVLLSPALQEFGNPGEPVPSTAVPSDGAWRTHQSLDGHDL